MNRKILILINGALVVVVVVHLRETENGETTSMARIGALAKVTHVIINTSTRRTSVQRRGPLHPLALLPRGWYTRTHCQPNYTTPKLNRARLGESVARFFFSSHNLSPSENAWVSTVIIISKKKKRKTSDTHLKEIITKRASLLSTITR